MTPQTAQEWSEFFSPLLQDIRSRRKPLDQSWQLFHSAWRGRNTRSFFKSDTFNHFVPAARRAVERAVTRTVQMLVPSPEFFEVYPADEMSDLAGKEAEATRAFHSYLWSKRIKPYPLARQLCRSYFIYSRAIAKTSVRVVRDGQDVQVWPHARSVDPWQFYAFPETVTDLDEAVIVFEDNMMPWETYKQNIEAGLVPSIKQEDLTKPEWPDHYQQRLAHSGITDPTALNSIKADESTPAAQKPLVRFVALTEVWVHRGSYWQMFWLVWNVPDSPRVVRINKYPFPRHPYRMAAARDIAGEHYTTGLMDDLEPLQVLLNDQINMTLEGQALSFSPPTAIDPDRVARMSSIQFRPRAKWLVQPEGVKFMEFPDMTKVGVQGVQFTMGLIDNYAGMGPLAEGTPTRNMPRSGFAVSSLIQLSMADIKDAAQMIEDMILTPLMGDLHKLLSFVPPEQVMRIPGTQALSARLLRKQDMKGEWDFKWVGSLQTQDFMVRGQRLIATIGMLAKLAPIIGEDLLSRGKRVNWELLLKRAWRDGLGERGADSIIEEIPPEELVMLQAQRLLSAIASGQQAGAKQAGMENAAKANRQGQGGGGGNQSIPVSAEGAERNQSRQVAEPPPSLGTGGA